jgi:hypothetical protein
MTQINPERIYTLVEIVPITKEIGWIKTRQTLKKWIDYDREHDNVLKSIVKGYGNGKRYYIQGINLISYLAQFEDGSLSGKEVQKIAATPVKV